MTIATSRHASFASAVRAVLHTPRDVSAPTPEPEVETPPNESDQKVRWAGAPSHYEITFKVALYHEATAFEDAYFGPTLDITLRETDWSHTMLLLSKMIRELAPMYAGDRIALEVSCKAWTYSYDKIVARDDCDLKEIADQIERKA